MLVLARIEFVPFVHRLDFDLPQIKQKIATITATTNIMPKMQKASANFDDDMHKIPSDRKWRNLAGYSSTKKPIVAYEISKQINYGRRYLKTY